MPITARTSTYAEQLAMSRPLYKNLDPLDLKQCMAEFKEPHQPFRIGFPEPRWQRCDRVPSVVALETELAKDGTRGAMSLCRSCARECKERKSGVVYIGSAPFKAAFKLGGHEAVVALIYSYGLSNT